MVKSFITVILAILVAVFCLVVVVNPVGTWAEPPDTSNRYTWMTDGTVYAIAHADGITYIGGDFTAVHPSTGGSAELSTSTGKAMPPYMQVNGYVYAVVPDGSGGWYIGGNFTRVCGVERNNIAHISDETLDTSWDPNANGSVFSLVVDNGAVYAGGWFTSIGGQSRNCIAALDASTGLATNWDPNANSHVRALAVSDGVVYAGGDFTSIGGQSRNCIAALDASTGLATDWAPNAEDRVYALAVGGVVVYVGGWFTSIGGKARNHIAAIDISTGDPTPWDPNANGTVYSLAVGDGVVNAGGYFSAIGGVSRNRIAAIDASTGMATDWAPNANNRVYALEVGDGVVYAGGWFTSIGGEARSNIAAIDASTGMATDWDPNANSWVYALAVNDGVVYAGGWFTQIGGESRNRIAAIDASTGMATNWNPNANSVIEALVMGNGVIYAGGGFTSIGGATRRYIAAIDISTGDPTPWDPNANGEVVSFAVDDGVVYAGGWFTSIGGEDRNYIAAIDTSTGLATPWDPDANSPVKALSVDNRVVYAGGKFQTIGVEWRNRIAAIDALTGLATDWDPDTSSDVEAIAVVDRAVYAGGFFNYIGDEWRSNFAQFGTYGIAKKSILSPSGLGFGEVQVDDTLSLKLVMNNTTDEYIIVGTATDPATPYNITTDACSDTTLHPGDTCSITIQFAPVSMGTFYSAFQIPTNYPDAGTLTISLSGTGVSTGESMYPQDSNPAGPKPIVLDHKGPSRGREIGDTASIDTSSEDEDISTTGDPVAVETSRPFTADAGSIASAPSPRVISSLPPDSLKEPEKQLLLEEAQEPFDRMVFGKVKVGASDQLKITLSHKQGAAIRMGDIIFPSVPYLIVEDNCSGTELDSGGECAVTVQFTPTTANNFYDFFLIPTDDPEVGTLRINLSGSGFAE